MKAAIEFLKANGIEVNENGLILSNLPSGIEGISLIDMLEESTMEDDFCYTIIEGKIQKIEC